MENHSARHTAWIVGAIVFSALLISGVIVAINYSNQTIPTVIVQDTVATPLVASVSVSPSIAVTPVVSASPQASSTSIVVLPSTLPSPSHDVVVITDQAKKFRWNEISFQYPGNWTAGAEQNAVQGIKLSSIGKEDVSITCPVPEVGFEGWDFDHPLMSLKQSIPGTNNQYEKSLAIAQPVLEWGRDGKPVLDARNKNGNGWMALTMIRKFDEPNVPGLRGCLIKAIYNHAPTASERQSLQTMYNSIVVEAANAKVATEADTIIRYVNPNFGFTINFPKSWQKIKEENVTAMSNKDNPKPYRAVLRFSPDGVVSGSGKHFSILIYDKNQLGTDPTSIDVPGILFLGQNNKYGYYWAGNSCDAPMPIPDCRTGEEMMTTNSELSAIRKSFAF